MTSITDDEQDSAISDKSRVTLSVVFTVAAFIVTGILVFSRLEARVGVIENSQRLDEERLSRHETTEAERLKRIEEKLDRLIEGLHK